MDKLAMGHAVGALAKIPHPNSVLLMLTALHCYAIKLCASSGASASRIHGLHIVVLAKQTTLMVTHSLDLTSIIVVIACQP